MDWSGDTHLAHDTWEADLCILHEGILALAYWWIWPVGEHHRKRRRREKSEVKGCHGLPVPPDPRAILPISHPPPRFLSLSGCNLCASFPPVLWRIAWELWISGHCSPWCFLCLSRLLPHSCKKSLSSASSHHWTWGLLLALTVLTHMLNLKYFSIGTFKYYYILDWNKQTAIANKKLCFACVSNPPPALLHRKQNKIYF